MFKVIYVVLTHCWHHYIYFRSDLHSGCEWHHQQLAEWQSHPVCGRHQSIRWERRLWPLPWWVELRKAFILSDLYTCVERWVYKTRLIQIVMLPLLSAITAFPRIQWEHCNQILAVGLSKSNQSTAAHLSTMNFPGLSLLAGCHQHITVLAWFISESVSNKYLPRLIYFDEKN